MNIDPSQLTGNGYHMLHSLNHKELPPFISNYLFRKNAATLSYLFINLVLFALLVRNIIVFMISAEGTVGEALKFFGYGCAITFLFIAPHELLHGLAYKISGAKKVSYKANWRKLYFIAIADKFVVSKNPFYFIALLPITIISMVALLAAWFTEPGHQIMWTTVALVHASMCAGDFGLISFFEEHKNQDIVTYDDAVNEVSYFYAREKI